MLIRPGRTRNAVAGKACKLSSVAFPADTFTLPVCPRPSACCHVACQARAAHLPACLLHRSWESTASACPGSACRQDFCQRSVW